MSLPKTCPFCGSGGELRNADRWVRFTCMTVIHAGHDARRMQSETCAGLERTRLLARVAELEEANRSNRVVMGGLSAVVDAWKDHCKRLEEAGDEMADWNMNERNLGCDPELAHKWQQAKEAKP